MDQYFGITLQTQPTHQTCVQTCLAMALNVPVSNVIDRYGRDAKNQEFLLHALTECSIVWNQFTVGTLLYQGWYFMTVPSLNQKGINHQILTRWTFQEGLYVMDPAIGERYKQDGSNLKSWADLIPFLPGGILPKK